MSAQRITREWHVLAATLLVLVSAPRVAAQKEAVDYYGVDAVGSIRVVFRPDGTVVSRADYAPFGEATGATGGQLPPVQFTGQERDPEAVQDNFHARYYQPRHGRFGSIDPIFGNLFDPQQLNRYAYALNSPLMFVDPDGRNAAYRGPWDCPAFADHGPAWCQARYGGAFFEDFGGGSLSFSSGGASGGDPAPKGLGYATGESGQALPTTTTDATSPPTGPPPITLPPGKNGQPNEWKPTAGSENRPVRWSPKYPVASPNGSQPSSSWDARHGHWDYDDGFGNRFRFTREGRPTSHGPLPYTPLAPFLDILWRMSFPLPVFVNPCLLSGMPGLCHGWLPAGG